MGHAPPCSNTSKDHSNSFPYNIPMIVAAYPGYPYFLFLVFQLPFQTSPAFYTVSSHTMWGFPQMRVPQNGWF